METLKLTRDQLVELRNHIFRYGIGDYISLDETIDRVIGVFENVSNTKIEYDQKGLTTL
jgi:hypothetical protein